MQVYNTYFKIIRKHLFSMSIYLIVFLAFAAIFTQMGGTKQNLNFAETKSKIVIINEDQASPLIEGLIDYLGQKATIVDLKEDKDKMQDALFFRQIDYILKIPSGFTASLQTGENIQLEKTTVPNSTNSVYVDLLINRYFDLAKMYMSLPDQSFGFNKMLAQDLAIEAKVEVSDKETEKSDNNTEYFSFMAYSLMAIIILSVTSVMITFNEPDLRRRNSSSPLNITKMNLQLILGNLTFAVMVWFIFIAFSVVIYGLDITSWSFILRCVNTLVFTLVCLAIGFAVGSFIKSRSAQGAIANVLSLGFGFISGVFVPQELLGKTVQTLGSFTPTYWFIKANRIVGPVTTFDWSTLTPAFYSMLIQLAFAIAILSITLVITKQRRVSKG